VLRLLKHVWDTRDEQMVIGAMDQDPAIYVFTDASFDTYKDSKSHGGVCVFITGSRCALHSSSNKQHCLARSSCDSEIIECEKGTFIGNYFRDVLEELKMVCNVIQFQDNQSCIALVDTGTSSYDRKERHVVRRINYMYDYFADPSNRSKLLYCPTLCMIADILTKPLNTELYLALKQLLMGLSAYVFIEEDYGTVRS